MPVTTEEKKGGKKAKVEKVSGAQPLPVGNAAADPKKDAELVELAKKQNAAIEETRKKLKELQEQLKAAKEEEKKAKDAEKAARDAEKNKGKAEREAKEKAIKEADEAVAQAQKDLEATEEWAFLVSAKEARAALGSLPKARKVREGGGGGGVRATREGKYGDLTGAEYRTMKAINDAGHALSRKELAEATGQEKGWSKLLGTKDGGNGGLCDRGLLNLIMHESEPMRYALTEAGREALEKAQAEPAETPAE